MILAVQPTMVIVVPRSASRQGRIQTPASASPGFSKPGDFSRWRRPVSRYLAEQAQNHGQLAEPYRSQVLALFPEVKT